MNAKEENLRRSSVEEKHIKIGYEIEGSERNMRELYMI